MKRTVTTDDLSGLAREALDYFTQETKGRDHALVIGLRGDLGAGKTTFTQHFAHVLGIGGMVASPTFVIEKVYKLPDGGDFDRLIHIDAYRLGEATELRALGWDDIVKEKRNVIVVEWPQNVKDVFPDDAQHVSFTVVDEHTREVSW